MCSRKFPGDYFDAKLESFHAYFGPMDLYPFTVLLVAYRCSDIQYFLGSLKECGKGMEYFRKPKPRMEL